MSGFSVFLEQPLAERIGWMLLHSLWQIALVAALYALAARLLRRRAATTRYGLSCVALAACFALPIYSFILFAPVSDHTMASATRMENEPAASIPATNDVLAATLGSEHATPVQQMAERQSAEPDVHSAILTAEIVATDTPVAIAPWRTRLAAVLPWLAAVWFVGVPIFALRPIVGLLAVRRLRSRAIAPPNPALVEQVSRLCARLGIRRVVEIAESALVRVPTVVGHLRPLVLLPASALTGLAVEELELVIAHELAHVRRHDYLVNVAQTVIETLLFFHPCVWWLSGQVRQEREHCCDDVAVALCGDRRTYVRALYRLEQQRQALAPALAATGGSLVERVRRLTAMPSDDLRTAGGSVWLAGAIASLALAGVLWMGQARVEADAVATDVPVAAVTQEDGNDVSPTARQAAVAEPNAVLAGETPAPQDAQESRAAQKATEATENTKANSAKPTTLTGRFVFDGTPPEPKNLKIPLGLDYLVREGTRVVQREGEPTPEFVRAAAFGVPDESLLVDKTGGIANVMIWLKTKIGSPPLASPLPTVILRAKNYRFEPHVMTFWDAATLRLENDGPEPNVNIYWSPIGDTAVNPLLKLGDQLDVRITRSQAVPVRVTSNIQPWLSAYVLPLDHPYAAVSGKDGRFEIKNLPPGEWEFRIWHERTGWLKTEKHPLGRFKLGIGEGENSLGDIHVAGQTLLNSERITPSPTAAPPAQSSDSRNDQGFSPLHVAAMNGKTQRVRELLDQGANVDAQQEQFHGTPLQYAAHKGHLEVAKALIEHHATVDSQDSQGRTPMMWAATGGHADMIQLLLDSGANIDAENNGGWTPLHFAAAGGHQPSAQRLIDRGADPNATNSAGKTPLDIASTTRMKLTILPAEAGDAAKKTAPVVVHLMNNEGQPIASGGMTYAHIGVPPEVAPDRIQSEYYARYFRADAQGTIKSELPTGMLHLAFRLGWNNPRFIDWNIPARGLTKTVRLNAEPDWKRLSTRAPHLELKCKLMEEGGRYFIEATVRSQHSQPFTLGTNDIQIWSPVWNGGWYVYPGEVPKYAGMVVPPSSAGHLTLRLPWSDYLERGRWYTYGPLSVDWMTPAEGPGPEREFFSISVADGTSLIGLPIKAPSSGD